MSSVGPREKGRHASWRAPSGGCATTMAFTEGASTSAVHGWPSATATGCFWPLVPAWSCRPCAPARPGAAGLAAVEPLALGVLQAEVQPELASTAKLAGSSRAFRERKRLSRERGRAAVAAGEPPATVWRRSLEWLARSSLVQSRGAGEGVAAACWRGVTSRWPAGGAGRRAGQEMSRQLGC